MTDSATPPDDGEAQPRTPTVDPAKDGHKRPLVWMIIAAIAVVAAIGLGLWALKINSDLEASQSDLAAQTAAAEAAKHRRQNRKPPQKPPKHRLRHRRTLLKLRLPSSRRSTESNGIYVVSDEDVAQAESDAAAAQAALDEANAALAATPRTTPRRFAPSSNRPGPSATWHAPSASRRGSAREGHSV